MSSPHPNSLQSLLLLNIGAELCHCCSDICFLLLLLCLPGEDSVEEDDRDDDDDDEEYGDDDTSICHL